MVKGWRDTIFYELKISADISKPLISAFPLKSGINEQKMSFTKSAFSSEQNFYNFVLTKLKFNLDSKRELDL